jgi:hypothetical protein
MCSSAPDNCKSPASNNLDTLAANRRPCTNCHSTNTLFNCLIYFLIEAQSLNNEVRRDAQTKYSLCLNMLYEFSQLWVSASLIHRLFESLQANMQFPQTRPSSLFSDQWNAFLPGLRISSEISNSYMRQ